MVDTILVIASPLATSQSGPRENHDESAAKDWITYPEVPTAVVVRTRRADCEGEDQKAISKEEACP
jgi:hypothetical protein